MNAEHTHTKRQSGAQKQKIKTKGLLLFLCKGVEILNDFMLRTYFTHKNGAGRFDSVSAK